MLRRNANRTVIRPATVLGTAALAVGLSLGAFAEPSAEDALSYRESVMTSLKGHIGAASMIVRGIV